MAGPIPSPSGPSRSCVLIRRMPGLLPALVLITFPLVSGSAGAELPDAPFFVSHGGDSLHPWDAVVVIQDGYVEVIWGMGDLSDIGGFRLHVGTGPDPNSDGGSANVINDTIFWSYGDPPVTKYNVPVEDGVTYNWSVQAYNAEGWGPWSEVFTFTAVYNAKPTARVEGVTIAGNPVNRVPVNHPVRFAGNGSDADGSVVAAQWTYARPGEAEQPIGEGFVVEFSFPETGSFVVYFRVRDDVGLWSDYATPPPGLQVETNHPPQLAVKTPSVQEPLMNEGESLTFDVDASDPNGIPLTYRWYVDGRQAQGEERRNFTYVAGNNSAGRHPVRCTISDGAFEVEANWTLVVNGRPEAFQTPAAQLTLFEGDRQTFSVSASDPEQDPLTFQWRLDGVPQAGDGPAFNLSVPFDFAGDHALEVTISDGRASTVVRWTLHVLDREMVTIKDWGPEAEQVTVEEGRSLYFWIEAESSRGRPLSYNWYLDGRIVPGAHDREYLLVAEWGSEGTHLLRAEAYDEDLVATREWTVIVEDDNRPPNATISTPKNNQRIEPGAEVRFDGSASYDPDDDLNGNGRIDGDERSSLTYRWESESPAGVMTLSDKPVFSWRFEAGTYLIRLNVSDGKASAEAFVGIVVEPIPTPELTVGSVRVSPRSPFAGDRVRVHAEVTNDGEEHADNLTVEIVVVSSDGETTLIIDEIDIAAGETRGFDASWEAVEGTHKIWIRLYPAEGDAESTLLWSGEVTEQEEPIPVWYWALPTAVVILLVLGLAVYAGSRKVRQYRDYYDDEEDDAEEPGEWGAVPGAARGGGYDPPLHPYRGGGDRGDDGTDTYGRYRPPGG